MLVVISQLIEKKRSMDKGRDVSGVKKKLSSRRLFVEIQLVVLKTLHFKTKEWLIKIAEQVVIWSVISNHISITYAHKQ